MQALAVDHEQLRRGGDDGLEGVFQGPAILGLRLAKLCDFHHLAFESVAPLRIQVFVLDQRTVGLGVAADGPKERGEEGVFAAAMVAAHEDGVVDLVRGELHFMGQGVQKVLTLEGLGDHALDVRQPHGHIARLGCGARVAPAVAVNQTVTGDQDGRASGVSDASQRLGTLGLSVLVKRHGRLDFALDVVNRLAVNVAEQGVEGATGQLAPVLHVEVGVIVLYVREAAPPFGLFDAAKLFTVNLGDDARGLVGIVGRGRELGQRRVHGLRQQLFTQAWGVRGAAIVGHPLQEQTRVEVNAMGMQAAIGAVGGHVAAFGVAVGVLCVVGADDARPAFAVGLGQ